MKEFWHSGQVEGREDQFFFCLLCGRSISVWGDGRLTAIQRKVGHLVLREGGEGENSGIWLSDQERSCG